MADTKISNLTSATADDGLEIPVNAAGTTKKITLGDALAHSHEHVQAEITDFTHTHVKADITDFTHTHAAVDVTDLQEVTEDRIATTIVAGTNLSKTYDDGAGILTLDVDSHTHASTEITDFAEGVDDRVSALLTAGSGVALTYNDGAGTLTIEGDAHTHTASDVTDFTESLEDGVANLLTEGANISLSYNDTNGTLSITAATGTGLGGFYDVTAAPYNAVGDGLTDDRASILAAIADANGNGGVVWFPPGTYMVGYNSGDRAGILMNGITDVHFRGAGQGVSIIKQKSGGTTAATDFHLFNLDTGCTNISWDNLTLDGNKASITANDDTSHLIECEDVCTDIRIRDVHFKDAIGDGVRLLGTSGSYTMKRAWVDSCRFTDCGRSGVAIQRGCEYVWVTNCYFTGIADQSLTAETTGTSSPRHLQFVGNQIEHTLATVPVAFAGTSTSDVITDLVFARNFVTGGGVDFRRIDNVLFQGNTITQNQSGIATPPFTANGAITNMRIIGNTFNWTTTTASGSVGAINMDIDSSLFPSDILIANNRIRTTTTQSIRGMDLRGDNYTIVNNLIQGQGVAASRGVSLANLNMALTTGFTFSGNRVLDYATGLKMGGDATHLMNGFVITNNYFDNLDFSVMTEGMELGVLSAYYDYAKGAPVIMGNSSGNGVTNPITNTGTGYWVIGGNAFDTVTAAKGCAFFECSGSPESQIAANVGSFATDRASGSAYIKTSGTSNTGWLEIQVA